MHKGADLQVPRLFFYIMKFATPAFAIALLGWWIYGGMWPKLMMKDVQPEHVPYLWLARAIIVAGWLALAWGVGYAWRTHPKFFEEERVVEPGETLP
jgi:hypothetical protein